MNHAVDRGYYSPEAVGFKEIDIRFQSSPFLDSRRAIFCATKIGLYISTFMSGLNLVVQSELGDV
jgi:hypothetical protein